MKLVDLKNSNDEVIILAATNAPWSIHSAVRRVFEKRIYIPPPDYNSRIEILKHHLNRIPHELDGEDLPYLAEKTEGYCCADIINVVRDASFEPLRMAQVTTTFKMTKITPEGEPVYEPCAATDPDAKHINLFYQGPEQLTFPKVSLGNFESALNGCKSSISKEEIQRQVKFMQEYGSED